MRTLLVFVALLLSGCQASLPPLPAWGHTFDAAGLTVSMVTRPDKGSCGNMFEAKFKADPFDFIKLSRRYITAHW